MGARYNRLRNGLSRRRPTGARGNQEGRQKKVAAVKWGASELRFGRGLPTSSPTANPVSSWKDSVPEEGLLPQIKRLVVGRPIPSRLAHHERLSRVTGLAVLSSDALSSVAYATEEIVRVLILVSAAALVKASPIALVIAAILAVVVFSYRQTIHAYPTGGGA